MICSAAGQDGSPLASELLFNSLCRIAHLVHRCLQPVGRDPKLVRPIAHLVVLMGIDAATVLRSLVREIIAHPVHSIRYGSRWCGTWTDRRAKYPPTGKVPSPATFSRTFPG